MPNLIADITVYIYGQVLTFARRCNATSFGMVQMYCK